MAMTRGAWKRTTAMAAAALLVTAGIGLLAWGGARFTEEADGAGPARKIGDDTTALVIGDGENFLAAGSAFKMYDSQGRLLMKVDEVAPDVDSDSLAFNPGMFRGGHLVTPSGILDVKTRVKTVVPWPDDFGATALDIPYVFGVNESGPARMDVRTTDVEALAWPGPAVDWNQTRISAVHEDLVILHQDHFWRDENGSHDINDWFAWNLDAGTVTEFPLAPGEHLSRGGDILAATQPFAFHRDWLLVLAEGQRTRVRAFDANMNAAWNVTLESGWDYSGIASNDVHWVVNYMALDTATFSAVRGFMLGEEDALTGHRQLDGAVFGLGSTGAWPVGDHIVFAEGFNLYLADPSRTASTLSWVVLSAGVLLLATGLAMPMVRRQLVARGTARGQRCDECEAKLPGDSAFCIFCGWSAESVQ